VIGPVCSPARTTGSAGGAGHWLGRPPGYADTKDGGPSCTAPTRHPPRFAYTYRDYVIRALKRRTRRSDRFSSHETNSARRPDPAGRRALAAGGASAFLTLGRMFRTTNIHGRCWDDRNRPRRTRGFLGLDSLLCARLSRPQVRTPSPTADYYSLYGVLRETARRPWNYQPSAGRKTPPTVSAFEAKAAPMAQGAARVFSRSPVRPCSAEDGPASGAGDYLVKGRDRNRPTRWRLAVFFPVARPGTTCAPQVTARLAGQTPWNGGAVAEEPVFGPWARPDAPCRDADFAAAVERGPSSAGGRLPAGTTAGPRQRARPRRTHHVSRAKRTSAPRVRRTAASRPPMSRRRRMRPTSRTRTPGWQTVSNSSTGPDAPGLVPEEPTPSTTCPGRRKTRFGKQQTDLDKLAASAATRAGRRGRWLLADAEQPWEPRVLRSR